ncbi:MAG: glutathione S-transferase family protein [Candidatus Puniceispirillum sp.]
MGLLVDGHWSSAWYDTSKSNGKFVREIARFRNWITVDGAPGPTGAGGFTPESGRYHLYVSYACPWAHRTLIFRHLKGLDEHITVSVVHPLMLEHGWTFELDEFGASGDHLLGKSYLHQVYTESTPAATGRVTVPVLWDKHRGCIVSNESSEIIRMFNTAFDGLTGNERDYFPKDMRTEIEAVNADIYDNINNGVYLAGFATTTKAYEEAVTNLFAALDRMEARLQTNRYLLGSRLTEADWRLFVTLIRFDAVYVGHFKCNIRRIADYPALHGFTCDLYQMPGIADTVVMSHIKQHYYASHPTVNPTGIVPIGPVLDFTVPHGREALTS